MKVANMASSCREEVVSASCMYHASATLCDRSFEELSSSKGEVFNYDSKKENTDCCQDEDQEPPDLQALSNCNPIVAPEVPESEAWLDSTNQQFLNISPHHQNLLITQEFPYDSQQPSTTCTTTFVLTPITEATAGPSEEDGPVTTSSTNPPNIISPQVGINKRKAKGHYRIPGDRSKRKSSYKHVPHSEKPPHLVAKRNARERRRVHAVNLAFVRLRKAIPFENKRGKRISKVKVLQKAIDYIRGLRFLIADNDGTEEDFLSIEDDKHLFDF